MQRIKTFTSPLPPPHIITISSSVASSKNLSENSCDAPIRLYRFCSPVCTSISTAECDTAAFLRINSTSSKLADRYGGPSVTSEEPSLSALLSTSLSTPLLLSSEPESSETPSSSSSASASLHD